MMLLLGGTLIVVWIALVWRFPLRAALSSLCVTSALLLIISIVLWQNHQEKQQLAQLALDIQFAPEVCGADSPLQMTVHNGSAKTLHRLTWQLAAYPRNNHINVVDGRPTSYVWHGTPPLAPNKQLSQCVDVPPLRSGYRPRDLTFVIEQVEGDLRAQ